MKTQNETQNVTYQNVTQLTIDAIRNDTTAVSKWLHAGQSVAAFFSSKEALIDVKAQFCADAILPAIDKRHLQALDKELPRKGTKEFNALDESGRSEWEQANQAKKDARAIVATYFARILKYAFPPEEKDATESVTASVGTRLSSDLSAWIKRLEKTESAEFDIALEIKALKAALAIAAKGAA